MRKFNSHGATKISRQQEKADPHGSGKKEERQKDEFCHAKHLQVLDHADL